MKAVSKPKPMKSAGGWGASEGADGGSETLVPFAGAEHVGAVVDAALDAGFDPD